MTFELYSLIIIISAGFASGLLVGFASGTAGLIMLPVLTIFLKNKIHISIGTSLIIDFFIGGVAGTIFYLKNNVKIKESAILLICSIIGAFIGSQFTSFAPEKWLLLFTSISLMFFGINFLVNGIQKNVDFINSKFKFKIIKNNIKIASIFAGLIIGFVSGFSGIGGGGFIAIILILIFGYNVRNGIGTSLIMLSLITGSGAIGQIINGNFLLDATIYVVPSACIGAFIGSNYANKVNEDLLGRLIGLIVLIMGMAVFYRMLFS